MKKGKSFIYCCSKNKDHMTVGIFASKKEAKEDMRIMNYDFCRMCGSTLVIEEA